MTPSGEPLPPSMRAAERGGGTQRRPTGGAQRAYPAAPQDDDLEATAMQLAATRALLRAQTPQEAADVVRTLVHDLGGGLLPARLDLHAATLPLDVSLGVSEPVLPFAEPVSVAAMRLAVVMPTFLEDAKAVLARLQVDQRRDARGGARG